MDCWQLDLQFFKWFTEGGRFKYEFGIINGRASHSLILLKGSGNITPIVCLSHPIPRLVGPPQCGVRRLLSEGLPHPGVASSAHSEAPLLSQGFHPVGEKGILGGGVSEDKDV